MSWLGEWDPRVMVGVLLGVFLVCLVQVVLLFGVWFCVDVWGRRGW